MFKLLSLVITFALISLTSICQVNNKIIIVTEFGDILTNKLDTLLSMDFSIVNPFADSTRSSKILVAPAVSGERYTWTINADKSVLVGNELLMPLFCLAHPGDSIIIFFKNGAPVYSGKGSDLFRLRNKITEVQKKMDSIKPEIPLKGAGGRFLITKEEYLRLSHFYDSQISAIFLLIESYKSKLSQQDYNWIKCEAIQDIEDGRLSSFVRIPTDKRHFNFTHTMNDLAVIWDSTMYKPWAKWLRKQDIPGLSRSYFYYFSRGEVWRNLGFTMQNNDTLASKTMRVKLYYNNLVRNYAGMILERALCFLLDEQVTMEMGAHNPVAQRLLKDYYARSKFTGYKSWVKSLENRMQVYSQKQGTLPFFQLEDAQGKVFTEKAIHGKFTIMNFWYSGCKECKEKVTSLQNVQNEYKNDTTIVFLNICVDTDRNLWLRTKGAGTYAPIGGIHLFAGAAGKQHEILKDLDITEYPSLRYVNEDNEMIVVKPEPDPFLEKGQWLADFIRTRKSHHDDGPYIVKENGYTKAYYISNKTVKETNPDIKFIAATDQKNKKISFSLQKDLSISKSEYVMPEKMIVLSDIEGCFTPFRKLLQANRVIDADFNWTYGNGHLVLAGDMFDRGEQVTECLWLVYSLEEKAKAAGGLVHFILGNHEIMNLNGNERYVADKYKSNYKLLGKTLAEVYNENSELGRWLRTKNIVEKIGDNLFCHGGISPDVNNMNLTTEEINTKARPYYDKSTAATEGSDEALKVLFNARKSPFWYRHYYNEDYWSRSNNELIRHASATQIDSTCLKFGVRHIITGHTIVADTISVHYNGKVINTDTRHADGKSEALLIESGIFFRVDSQGNRILLFKEDSKHPTQSLTAPSNTHPTVLQQQLITSEK